MKVAVPPASAREFFLTRIAKEAQEEGRPLTAAQKTLLESGGESTRQQDAEFDRENPDYVEFIEWVTKLLARALANERFRDPATEQSYRVMLEELGRIESGSALWCAAVPAVVSGDLKRAFRRGWIIAVVTLLLGMALGFYAWKHGRW
jgi:hypothetical protein